MTLKLLKSTTAIVLSLSLALPTITMAQTAAELEAALGVDTSGMTEAELDELRKQLAKQQAEAATQAPETTAPETAAPEATAESTAEPAPEKAEEPGLLDRAVGAVTQGVEALTGGDEAEQQPEAGQQDGSAQVTTQSTAEAEATTQAETQSAPDAGQTTTADTSTQAEAGATAEAGTDAQATDNATDNQAAGTESGVEAQTTTEATTAQQSDTTATSGDPVTQAIDEGQQKLQSQVDELKTKLDALTNESAEEQAERQAATEAEAAEAQATSMAATAGDDAAAAEVVEQTVTEETARSSSEEFQTSATAAPAATAAPTESRKEGLDTLGKIALFGLGALAVGQILKNGSEVVSNSGDRVVVQQPDGSYKVYKNDDVLMFQPGTDVKTYAYDDGSTRTVATRDDGTQIETIRAADGTVLRRTRILANGDRVVLFDDTQVAQRVEVNKLPQVDRADRAINFQQAKEEELRAALQARLPQEIDRRFSLSQVRNITAVRNLVPEIDVDNINFETGSAIIRPDEAEELAELGFLMRQAIEANPGEVFLIEGHTDAVGSASYNLALSDRRAESVALALSEYFDVPPENMVVQGYGESDLKIRTAAAERENRRASVRRITPLLNGS
jgi:outer membrane protein OmpA-like peptidoglycan-associated protein/FtsZ-binding cell division protein ZapB